MYVYICMYMELTMIISVQIKTNYTYEATKAV